MTGDCNCGHKRSAHANGIWECKWCDCKSFTPEEVPDLFDNLGEPVVKCRAIGPHHGDECNWGRIQSPNAQFTRECPVCKGTGIIKKSKGKSKP